MKIKDRLIHLQKLMERSLESGASEGDIKLYESSIYEFKRISEWIKTQCIANNRIYYEKQGIEKRAYIEFENTTNMNFRFIAMEVKIIRNEAVIDSFEIATANWKAAKKAKLYIDKEIKENDALSFDPNTIEYQVM